MTYRLLGWDVHMVGRAYLKIQNVLYSNAQSTLNRSSAYIRYILRFNEVDGLQSLGYLWPSSNSNSDNEK